MTAHRPLAIITGATAGIGRAYCERLAARGLDLLLVARDVARLDDTAKQLAATHGVNVRVEAVDLADAVAVEALAVRLAVEPRVDLLLNNAGFGTTGALAVTPSDAQQRLVHVHCLAPLRLAQAVLPGMLARAAGAIVNVSSIAAFLAGPGNATYAATKGFVRLLSEGMAAEVVGTGVRIQALCPGFTRTEFHARMGTGDRGIPSGSWMSPDAVVDASLRALDRGGPVVVIPGFRYKVLVAGMRHTPLRLLDLVRRRLPRTRG